MSDFSQGPGWWQASDGKWYPPEQAPGGVPAAGAAPGMGVPGAVPAGAPGGELASWGERAIAFLIDGAIIFVISIALAILGAIFGAVSDALAVIFSLLRFVVSLGAGLYFAYLAGQTGGSPGMRLTGLKLVGEADGQTIGGGQGIIRQIVAWAISFFTCGCGGIADYLWPLWDDKNQTLHDKVVKTLVLKGQEKMDFGPDLLKP